MDARLMTVLYALASAALFAAGQYVGGAERDVLFAAGGMLLGVIGVSRPTDAARLREIAEIERQARK